MASLERYISKAVEGFKERFVIRWPDGATTVFDGDDNTLNGTDGNKYEVRGEHEEACKQVFEQNNYTFRR